jgi:hypothetical protein
MPTAPAVVAAKTTVFSVDEIRAACAADTNAAILEAFEALLTAQATSGKDVTSDSPLSPRIIFDSGATTTMLPVTTLLDKRTPTSVRISLAKGADIRDTSQRPHSTRAVGCSIAAEGTRGPVVPSGLLAVRDIAAQTRFPSKNAECTASVASRCSVPRTCLFPAHCAMARICLTSGLDRRPCHAAGAAAIAPIRPADAVIHRVFVRAPAHTYVIAGLRAGVLPGASRRGIVGLDVVEIYRQAPLYLRAGTDEQGRSNRCSCPS